MNKEIKVFDNIDWEWKADQPRGELRGWANVYSITKNGKEESIIDRHKDIIQRGALKNSPAKIGIFLSHDYSLPIGSGIAYEKSGEGGKYGIFLEAKLAIDSASATLKERAIEAFELARLGVLKSLSIGFLTHDASYEVRDGKQIRNIKSLELLEVSLVMLGANQEAALSSIKQSESETKRRSQMLSIFDKDYCTMGQLEDAMTDLYLQEEAWLIDRYLKECCAKMSDGQTGVPHLNWGLIATDSHLRMYALKLAELMTNNGRAEHAAAQSFFEDFLLKTAPFLTKRRIFGAH